MTAGNNHDTVNAKKRFGRWLWTADFLSLFVLFRLGLIDNGPLPAQLDAIEGLLTAINQFFLLNTGSNIEKTNSGAVDSTTSARQVVSGVVTKSSINLYRLEPPPNHRQETQKLHRVYYRRVGPKRTKKNRR